MSAQELKHFTLEDLNFGGTNFRDMQPQNKYCTWWGNQLVRLDRNACYLVDKKTGKETELMTLAQFNKWLVLRRTSRHARLWAHPSPLPASRW